MQSGAQDLDKPLQGTDLFSGSGGLSFGFEKAGIRTVSAVDNWSDALETYKNNHRHTQVHEFDLGTKSKSNLLNKLTETEIVFGGPPCQGFSISGKRDPNDPRNLLYLGFYEVVAAMRPKLFLMENVPNLASMEKGRLLREIEDDFAGLGYRLSKKVLLASDFGVPQNRRRLFLVGTLSDDFFQFPTPIISDPLKRVTSEQAIGDLPEHSLENGSNYTSEPRSDYQKLMRKSSNGVFNHQITEHSETTKKIISLVPDGGNYKSLPPEYKDTRRVNIAWTRFSSDKPSLTIDTGHRHHFHYRFNRIPTVRESARLQSFPDNFVFFGSKTSQYKQVGNAVPPLMAAELGSALQRHFRENWT